MMSARLRKTGKIKQSGSQSTGRPCTGLTQIVGTGPDELTEYEVFILHSIPSINARTRLAAVDDTVGVCGVVFIITVFGVVVAHHVDGFGISRLVGHHHTSQSTCHRTACVHRPHTSSQPLRNDADTHGIGGIRLVTTKHGLINGTSIQYRM